MSEHKQFWTLLFACNLSKQEEILSQGHVDTFWLSDGARSAASRNQETQLSTPQIGKVSNVAASAKDSREANLADDPVLGTRMLH